MLDQTIRIPSNGRIRHRRLTKRRIKLGRESTNRSCRFQSSRQVEERSEHLLVVAVDDDALPNMRHFTIRVDEIGAPLDTQQFIAVHVLLAPGPVFLGDGVVFIGQQRKIEAVLVPKAGMALDAISADAQHSGPELLELGLLVAKRASLTSATWRVVAG